MQNIDQGVARFNEIVYRVVDSVGKFVIKRGKTGKLLTSRDIVLRGGPSTLNGRILSGVVGSSLEFPELGITYKRFSSSMVDAKGRAVFLLDKEE